jgi:resuscitation-promoting factor RpfB
MKKSAGLYLSICLTLLGLALLGFSFYRPVRITIDGETQIVRTWRITVGGIVNEAGVVVGDKDLVVPGFKSWLGWDAGILIRYSRPVQLWLPDRDLLLSFSTVERIPANLLSVGGLHLFPGDKVLWNGEEISTEQPLPLQDGYVLEYVAAAPIHLINSGITTTFYSSDRDLGAALWDEGIRMTRADRLSVPFDSPTQADLTINLQTSQPILIKTETGEIATRSAAGSVGQALSEAGVSLQGMDYSIPGEEQPLPEDGAIQVVRVREELVLEENIIPYTSETIADPNTEMGLTSVISAGQYGLEVTRVRIRYENETEVSRQVESDWVASQPQNEQIGYGTQIVTHTLDTPYGQLEYYRAVTVYATSYSPCRSGTDKCYYGTASGLPVKEGVIGVTRAWYNLFAGQQVYVPGYGIAVIGDIGGGVPGTYWIDLAFTDETYQPWHQDVVLYFLTPAPANVPSILP